MGNHAAPDDDETATIIDAPVARWDNRDKVKLFPELVAVVKKRYEVSGLTFPSTITVEELAALERPTESAVAVADLLRQRMLTVVQPGSPLQRGRLNHRSMRLLEVASDRGNLAEMTGTMVHLRGRVVRGSVRVPCHLGHRRRTRPGRPRRVQTGRIPMNHRCYHRVRWLQDPIGSLVANHRL